MAEVVVEADGGVVDVRPIRLRCVEGSVPPSGEGTVEARRAISVIQRPATASERTCGERRSCWSERKSDASCARRGKEGERAPTRFRMQLNQGAQLEPLRSALSLSLQFTRSACQTESCEAEKKGNRVWAQAKLLRKKTQMSESSLEDTRPPRRAPLSSPPPPIFSRLSASRPTRDVARLSAPTTREPSPSAKPAALPVLLSELGASSGQKEDGESILSLVVHGEAVYGGSQGGNIHVRSSQSSPCCAGLTKCRRFGI